MQGTTDEFNVYCGIQSSYRGNLIELTGDEANDKTYFVTDRVSKYEK